MRFPRQALIALCIGLTVGIAFIAYSHWNRIHVEVAIPGTPAADTAFNVIRFQDVTSHANISFVHEDSRTPMLLLPEVMGSGAAWLDYDRDGFVDVLFIQGGRYPTELKPATTPTSRLYRNLGNGVFDDVTNAVGLLTPGYGQGVAVGDYDNDGFPDFFVTNVDGGRLYHNEPKGSSRQFRDVTEEAGLKLSGWCSCCAFGDLHGNGQLDLFVGRYVDIDPKRYPDCIEKGRTGPVRTVCGPQKFPGLRSYLFRNNGDGKFTDISEQAGLENEGKALGAVIFDLDGDAKADIFVGNDEVLNHHYQNLGSGKFRSVGLRNGTAATAHGRTMGSMGIEVGDLTGRGLPDLFITTFLMESTVLFKNQGKGFFTDVSMSAGMIAASRDKVGWGTGLLDADGDGHLDLMVANGHTHRNADELPLTSDGKPQQLAQFAQLFLGEGNGRFREVSATAGEYFQKPHIGRGVAIADFDNDGRTDLAITHVGGPPAILRNYTQNKNHWVRLELEGSRHNNPTGSNRDGIGATVTIRIGERTLVRHLKGGGSYYSSADPRLVVGLGHATEIDEVTVKWPNAAGTVQRFGKLAVDQGHRLIER